MTEKQQIAAGVVIAAAICLIVPAVVIYGFMTWVMWGVPVLSELHALTRLLMLVVYLVLAAGCLGLLIWFANE